MMTLLLLYCLTFSSTALFHDALAQNSVPDLEAAKTRLRIKTLKDLLELEKADHLLPSYKFQKLYGDDSGEDAFAVDPEGLTQQGYANLREGNFVGQLVVNALDPLNIIHLPVHPFTHDIGDANKEIYLLNGPTGLGQLNSNQHGMLSDNALFNQLTRASQGDSELETRSVLLHPHSKSVIIPHDPNMNIAEDEHGNIVIFSAENSSEQLRSSSSKSTVESNGSDKNSTCICSAKEEEIEQMDSSTPTPKTDNESLVGAANPNPTFGHRGGGIFPSTSGFGGFGSQNFVPQQVITTVPVVSPGFVSPGAFGQQSGFNGFNGQVIPNTHTGFFRNTAQDTPNEEQVQARTPRYEDEKQVPFSLMDLVSNNRTGITNNSFIEIRRDRLDPQVYERTKDETDSGSEDGLNPQLDNARVPEPEAKPHFHHKHIFVHHHHPFTHHGIFTHPGVHISQNQQVVVPHTNVPVVNPIRPFLVQPFVNIKGGFDGTAANLNSQTSNVHGDFNHVNQNYQSAGGIIGNNAQQTNIQGNNNAVAQIQQLLGRNNHPKSSETDELSGDAEISDKNEPVLQYIIDFPQKMRRYQARRNKRSDDVSKLIRNPELKVDVPQTIENVGTVAKNSFNNKNAPLHHVNNFVGSVKDVMMSAIKVPPHDLIVPSKYKIVRKDDFGNSVDGYNKPEFLRSGNPAEENGDNEEAERDPLNVIGTFHRVGAAVRESIRSSKETLSHVGDIAHNARKVVQTARQNAPKLVFPAVASRLRNAPQKVTLTAPKILAIKHEDDEDDVSETVGIGNRGGFVGMGDMMDALAVSNPKKDQLEMEKVVIKRKLPKTRAIDRSLLSPSQIEVKRFPLPKPQNRKSLQDHVTEMRNHFNSLVKSKIGEQRQRGTLLKKEDNKLSSPAVTKVQQRLDKLRTTSKLAAPEKLKSASNKGGSKFLKNKEEPTVQSRNADAGSDYWDAELESFLTQLFQGYKKSEETVGNPQQNNSKKGIFQNPALLKPFMGRVTKKQVKNYLRSNGNDVSEEDVVGAPQKEAVSTEEDALSTEEDENRLRQMQKVLGAVNPLMFEKMFNETLTNNNLTETTPYDLFKTPQGRSSKSRTSMKMTRTMLTPFMGRKLAKQENEEQIEITPLDESERYSYDYYE